MSHLQRTIEESIATLRSLAALEEPLQHAVRLLSHCLLSGRKLLVCGNGGSASDATHLATEFLCRFKDDRRPYPAISLTANGEYMTAVCNDYHADEIFARQVGDWRKKVMSCWSLPPVAAPKTSCAPWRKPDEKASKASPCSVVMGVSRRAWPPST